MKKINIDIAVRPIRFAFIVRPNDKIKLLEIFRVNTCLWGGMYNPIIPFFKKVPTWWDRNGYRFENAAQIINGYLDFFEPDFLVESEYGLSVGLGYDPDRIIQLSDLLVEANGKITDGYGLSVTEIYQHLYQAEFQFVHKEKPNFIHVSSNSKKYDLFSTCIFGGFPQQENLKYYGSFYKEVFSSQEVSLNSDELKNLYKSEYICPLKIGSSNIQKKFNYDSDPTIFILNPNKPHDLIDFWNLRATIKNILAIPTQWLEQLSDFSKEFMLRNYRPLPNNRNGVMIHPTAMFSRSINEDEADKIFRTYIQVDKHGANTLQMWYPPIWRATPEHTVRKTRPILSSGKTEIEATFEADQNDIKFRLMSPAFIKNKYRNEYRWANVINLEDRSYENQLAVVFPTDYKLSTFPKLGGFTEKIISCTEGLVVFPRSIDSHAYWKIQSGDIAFSSWFNEQGITIQLSKSGRSAQQIIQTLGGFFQLNSIANLEIIKLLDELSKKHNKCATYHRFYNEGIKKNIPRESLKFRYFEILVDQKVVELGLEIKCSLCDSWNWCKLNKIDENMTCDFCLKTYKFPTKTPLQSKNLNWVYRVVGPFALNKYADGGYATALSLRFFGTIFSQGARDAGITWSTGMELLFPDKTKIESDFLIWYQRKSIWSLDYPTEFIFGEAKSFGDESFTKIDISRMKTLAKKYPGSILVFATMKEELSKNEISEIKKLAEWGRKSVKNKKTAQAPVVILTGTELFCEQPFLSITWQNKSEKHKQLAASLDHNVKKLADLTQQLYLNMPSYFSWMEDKWKKREKKIKSVS
jgi:hypothetical protein